MPPKRPNGDASASRSRKKAKLEADIRSDSESEESDGGYDFDEDSSEESSNSEPFQMPTNRKRGKIPAARRTIATKTKLKTKTAGQRNRVHVTFEVLFDQPLDIIVEVNATAACDAKRLLMTFTDLQLSTAFGHATSCQGG